MSDKSRSELALEQVAGSQQSEMPLWLHIMGVRYPTIVPAVSTMLIEMDPHEIAEEFSVGEGTDRPIVASVKLPRELADRLQVLLCLDSLSEGLGVQTTLQDFAVHVVAAALDKAYPPG